MTLIFQGLSHDLWQGWGIGRAADIVELQLPSSLPVLARAYGTGSATSGGPQAWFRAKATKYLLCVSRFLLPAVSTL